MNSLFTAESNRELYQSEVSNKDHVTTPRYVVEDMYKIIDIKSFNMCWFPFNHYDSEFKLKADELNIKYKATHKFDDMGNDFFIIDPPENCDLMISNPPFGIQNQIIKRSFELIKYDKIKAFALLLPLSTLETKKRADIYKLYTDKLSIGTFENRIKFKGCKTSFNKGCCWVCYNIPALKNKPFWWL